MASTVWRTRLGTNFAASNAQYATATDGGNEVYYAYNNGSTVTFGKSVDQGMNWQTEVAVGTADSVPLDVPLVKDSVTGRLWLLAVDNIDSAGVAAVLKISHSDDGGTTWSSWQTIDNGTSYTNTNGRFYRIAITAKNSIVNIIVSSEDQTLFTGPDLRLYRSTNGNVATPTFTMTTPWSAASQGNAVRPVMHYDELKNNIYGTWADNGATGSGTHGGHVIVTMSTDHGATWTTQDVASVASLDGAQGAGRPVVDASRGNVRVICMAPFGVGFAADIYEILSTDGGVTWGAASKKFSHGGGGSSFSHPIMASKGDYVYAVWCDANLTPQILREAHSTDGGATWSSPIAAATYVSGGDSDAPWVLATKNMMVAFICDFSDSALVKYTRNPVFMSIPDISRVLDNATRSNAGPPPSGSWSGSNGNVLAVGSSGDGLVVKSNTITQASGGSFRQGSWWNTLLASASHEAIVKISAALGASSFDGLDISTRVQNPQVGASVHAYAFGLFNEGSAWTIKRIDSSTTAPVLASMVGKTLASGDYLAAQSVGTSHRFWFCASGTTQWELLGNAEDATYSVNGFVGLDVTNSQTPAITALMGGAVVDPTIPTSVPVPVTPPPSGGTKIKADSTLPNLQVLIDHTNPPTNTTRVWTDITTDVRSLSFTRGGRSDELQRSQAGTLQMVLNNRAAKYDPTNGAGLGIKRAQWVQVNAIWAGVTYPRWTGVILTVGQDWPGAGHDATATVSCGDAMRVLNLLDLTGQTFPPQLISERVAAIAALAGLTANIYDASNSTLASDSPSATAASYLATLEAEENGRIFADEQGQLAFQSRFYSQKNELLTPTSNTIGENSGEIPYDTVEVDTDDGYLYNNVTVTGGDDIAQTASDATSEATYFPRTLTRTILGDSTEALAVAQYLVFRYKEPGSRVAGVGLMAQRRTSLWPTVLAAINGSKFTVKRRATGHTISSDYYVEQIAETVIPGASWRVAMQLSPVDVGLNLWVLDNSTYSVLDSTTQLTY